MNHTEKKLGKIKIEMIERPFFKTSSTSRPAPSAHLWPELPLTTKDQEDKEGNPSTSSTRFAPI
jgi:hypothetical protein